MDTLTNGQAAPTRTVTVPDVATEAHPRVPDPLPGDSPSASSGVLQDALPEITEAARKVGGFKRLSEIAAQLDRGGAGQ